MILKENDALAMDAFLDAQEKMKAYSGRYIRQYMAKKLNVTPENAGAYLAKFVRMGFAKRLAWGIYRPTPKALEWKQNVDR